MISLPIAAAAGLMLGAWFKWPTLVLATALLIGACVALDVPPLEMTTAWATLQVFFLIGAVLRNKFGRAG